VIRRVAPLFGLALLLSGLPQCSGSPTDGLDLEDHDSAPSAGDEATSVGDEVGAGGPDAPSGAMHHRADAGMDAGNGGQMDATVEASVEAGADATADVTHDVTTAADAHPDAPADATAEAGDGGGDAIAAADADTDASRDAGVDADVDSGSDAPICLVGTCTIGARQCSGNDVFGCTMGSDGCGLWAKLATCTDQTCVSAACTGVCAPGQTKCTGTATAFQGCSPLGLWGDPAPCTGSTPVCKQGACVACEDADGGTPCPDGG
jgi:hypothetical protein